MEYLVFVIALIFILCLLMFKGYLDNCKKKKQFVLWLSENYGVLPKRDEYKEADFQRISKYYKNHKEDGFFIDDITWNDLNMNQIFASMNYTYSSAGEEYLYYKLRSPIQTEEQRQLLEEQTLFFMDNAKERVRYQTYFAELGTTGKHSIYDYLHYLDGLGERSNLVHYLGDLALLLSIGFMFFSLQIGLLIFFLCIARNIISYFKIKNEIDPYITSFSYIFRLLGCVEKLEKLPQPIFQKETELLKKFRKEMVNFKAGSYILMSSGRGSAGGDLLEIFLDYLRMAFHLDLIKFNQMLQQVKKHEEAIEQMITITGQIETAIAIGAYRVSRDCYCVPVFIDRPVLNARNLYHPLIEAPVKNSITTKKGVLLTGSNASGKSTFLKTVAINAILAQTIHTVFADSYTGGCFRIFSSMSLRDDLSGGDSYYMVEIKALKRIMDTSMEAGPPVLCFVDEVLRGTNTVERIAASTQILKTLEGYNVLCFAATHDIELTHLLENSYSNYHFEEEIVNGDVVFNYKLMDGKATTRNAIRLLSVMGYEKSIINDAEAMAERFLRDGKWQ